MPDWISYFDSDHPLYVSARHRQVHAALIAQGMSRFVTPGAVVLDYGCGEALHAEELAKETGGLILCDAAPHVRERLARRVAQQRRIEVLSPEQVAALPDASLDLIVMHSVAQYLTESELDATLALFRRLINPGGLFVIGDIVPPDTSAVTDAVALLRLAAANGFFAAAVGGLVRTLLSGYWQLRRSAGLSRYSEQAMLDKLARAGFSGKRAAENIGHNQARMTFVTMPAVAR
jgi:SAM-dependent methyltransferase